MKNWRRMVNVIAPTLAATLGGPLAGMAVRAVSQGLLGKGDATDSEIYEALLDPAAAGKLKEIEAKFNIEMKSLDVDLAKIEADDRDSARDFSENTSIAPQVIISTLFIVGFFAVLIIVFAGLVNLTGSAETIIVFMLGVLSSGVTMVIKFWFGGNVHESKQIDKMFDSIPRSSLKK